MLPTRIAAGEVEAVIALNVAVAVAVATVVAVAVAVAVATAVATAMVTDLTAEAGGIVHGGAAVSFVATTLVSSTIKTLRCYRATSWSAPRWTIGAKVVLARSTSVPLLRP